MYILFSTLAFPVALKRGMRLSLSSLSSTSFGDAHCIGFCTHCGSPKGLRKFISSLPADRRRESIERQLRLLPRWIMEEVARTHPSEKVIKHLEACLKEVRLLALVENYGSAK